MSEIKRKLFDRLKEFYNDKDFVVGVMSNATHEEDRKTIIEFIDNEEDITIEDLILLSLYLGNKRKTTQKEA